MQYKKTESCRYFYTSSKNFEQSLDVYKPVLASVTEREDDSSNNSTVNHDELPLVVMVVGSAWLGHRSLIYLGTSWWNSSGPAAFARQGCVTVCIRHRGSFPRVIGAHSSQLLSLAYSSLPLLLLPVLLYSFFSSLATADAEQPYDSSTWSHTFQVLVWCLAACCGIWVILALGQRGAADFEEMLHDVADALEWVQKHTDSDILKLTPSRKIMGNDNSQDSGANQQRIKQQRSNSKKLVFGGYSSGGHVAATLLQRPELFQSRGLPPPAEFCDAALFVSGVLAVRPPPDNSTPKKSRWLTDLVTHLVFGKHGANQLPSPLYSIHQHHPRVPHVLIGCTREVFGLSWMDVFFCSREFCQTLQQLRVPARWVAVDSDHWNILASGSFSSVLQRELEWIMKQR